MNFENIKQAIEDLKAGKLILVADDEDRENESFPKKVWNWYVQLICHM